MNSSHIATRTEYFTAIQAMAGFESDIQVIVRQIRMARVKCGAILDKMETFEPAAGALEELRVTAEAVVNEINRLDEIVSELTGRLSHR